MLQKTDCGGKEQTLHALCPDLTLGSSSQLYAISSLHPSALSCIKTIIIVLTYVQAVIQKVIKLDHFKRRILFPYDYGS